MSRLPVEQWREAELSLYRRYTIELLRRYMRMSMELGRMPSIIGREFFRARVSSYRENGLKAHSPQRHRDTEKIRSVSLLYSHPGTGTVRKKHPRNWTEA